MSVVRWISRSLAPLTLFVAVGAYLHPPPFSYLGDWFLWFFAATMFALGFVLKPEEFAQTFKKPKSIAFGVMTQFTVMPSLGFAAAYLSNFDPELALGFIIVGCAPGAMASNVIAYLAGGAVAFSVALTTIATFLSPLVTPTLVKFLGGVFLPIPFWPMMKTILLTVLVPLAGGMFLRRFLGSARRVVSEVAPAVAVVSIVLIIGYAISANQERISGIGAGVFLLVVLLNGLGYGAGWLLSKLYGFDRPYQLALMIEIGMQNAGLGVALALRHFSSQTALPGALFATWCILTAAGVTSYLRRRTFRKGT